MRPTLLLGLVATLGSAAASQAVVLPFTGTVMLCQAQRSGTSCPGSGNLDVSWQVSGVTQLDGSMLQIGQAAPLQDQVRAGFGTIGGADFFFDIWTAGGQLNAGTVNLATPSVQGLGVLFDDFPLRATISGITSSFTGSGFTTFTRFFFRNFALGPGTLGNGGRSREASPPSS